MKTYIYKITTVLVSLLVLCSSCESFLSETPKDFLSPENLPNTEAECNMLLLGTLTYWKSNDYERAIDFLAECSTDAIVNGTSGNVMREGIEFLTWESNNEFIWKAWSQFYKCINASNIMIQKVPHASSVSDEKKDMYVAAARYMRAMSYFYLVRLYNDVLYLDEPVEDFTSANNMEKTRAADIYNKIIEDLEYAETYLPAKWDSGTERPTQAAAKSLLAWVYITMAGDQVKDSSMWAKAAAKAKEVMDNRGTYGIELETDFADLWLVANRYNKESIFAINFADGLGDNQATVEFRPMNVGTETGWALLHSTFTFMNKFDDNDKRKEATFLTKIVSEIDNKTYTVEEDFGHPYPHSAKWFDAGREDFSQRNKRTDAYIPVIRYGYVLLMYAEAENEANGPTANAYNAVNQLRSRAGMPDLSGLSQDQFREAIRKEWTYETTHERLYRFNLVRWGTYLSVMREYFQENYPNRIGNITEDRLYYMCPENDKLINPNL